MEDQPNYEPFTITEVNEYKSYIKKHPQEQCQCTSGGCGDGCWNRMLQIECTIGMCPTGENCTNNRFQKRIYPKIEIISAGDKGNGLRVLEDVVSGQFVIEYVGEVIDVAECPERMKGRRHFYFLSIDGQTGIDASQKGNLARFINHSCDPNCATQKWTVNGRTRVGIFALQDIPAGSELTFDYKFERIGCKKQRCLCGSSNCRGWLGAKPVDEDSSNKPSRVTFSNHNRYAQYLWSRLDLDEIHDIIQEEIPITIVKNSAKGAAPVFLNRCHRLQKLKHVSELHKFVHRAYALEKEELEKHEEKLRKKQTTSSLMFLDVERSAKSGFAYFDDAPRERKAKSAANQRLTNAQPKPPAPRKTTKGKVGRPRKNPEPVIGEVIAGVVAEAVGPEPLEETTGESPQPLTEELSETPVIGQQVEEPIVGQEISGNNISPESEGKQVPEHSNKQISENISGLNDSDVVVAVVVETFAEGVEYSTPEPIITREVN
eukprot:TRINITY_DN6187_c0_g1_i1.p1 TRINITY_DN6187_c0_g1~~TRINITY_DN6187_c0_g1_i1.p1  ORF type:complete len:534 (-),score=99.74 TRINITY_DN6187_c0_g1_i1:8-1474(-)